MSRADWKRDSRGNIDGKSRPVLYSDVVPVDSPPMTAITDREQVPARRHLDQPAGVVAHLRRRAG
jgi:hypothetical protein